MACGLARADQMKRMDEIAIQQWGIPSALLMERAADGIYQAVMNLVRENPKEGKRSAAVFSGAGNNGGDGVAVAAQMKKAGWNVRCFLVGRREKMTEDSREMERRLNENGGVLEDYLPEDPEQIRFALNADIIVDALFGIGLNSPLRGSGALAVQLINRSHARKISADIPSGVEANTGRILGDAVRADITVTFSMAKPGLFIGKGALASGKVIVHDIGIPEDVRRSESVTTYLSDQELVKSWLPARPADGHKGTFGRVLVIGGSVGYTGAPVLASKAAQRTGSGLVTVAVPSSIYPIVAVKCDEVMPTPVPAGENGGFCEEEFQTLWNLIQGKDAVLIGPGMGDSVKLDGMVTRLLTETEKPVILDADGLNVLSRHMDVLSFRRGKITILTPHDGEFSRLGGDPSSENRLESARSFAEQYGCVLILKGHNTIIALPDGICYVNQTGNSGMAKGGSGDILGGMLLSLLGQGLPAEKAAVCAVFLHGLAGDLAAAEKGEYGMLPTDLTEQIPYAIKSVILEDHH